MFETSQQRNSKTSTYWLAAFPALHSQRLGNSLERMMKETYFLKPFD